MHIHERRYLFELVSPMAKVHTLFRNMFYLMTEREREIKKDNPSYFSRFIYI